MPDTLAIKAYGGLTRLLSPFLPLYLKRRAAKGKEDPERLRERFGHASLPRPNGPLVWLHGASVGETTMLLPLIDRVLETSDVNVLLTSGTVTSADLMQKRLPARAIHQFVPVDTPGAVKRFLNHWQPDVAIWAESEIWPNLLRKTKKRGISTALINARMNERSIRGWRKHGVRNAQSVFSNFDQILGANENTARGLTDLLGRAVPVLGNLKSAALPLPADDAELSVLRNQIGTRPVWCAASTHEGEDEIVLTAHLETLNIHKTALLVLIPRHPERSQNIASLIEKASLSYAVRSKGEAITEGTQVYVMDTIGELGLALRIAPITVMCGSLLPGLSGHNPLEPARLGSAVLSGTHVASFQETYDAMFEGAAMPITNTTGLGPAISVLLSNAQALATARKLAKDFAESQDSVLEAVWEELEPILPPKISKADI